MLSKCPHYQISHLPSVYASQTDYRQPTTAQLKAAVRLKNNLPAHLRKTIKPNLPDHEAISSSVTDTATYPAPLVLPGDDLALDPDYPAQSLQDWIEDEDRNPLTKERRIIYVARPPVIDDDVAYVKDWACHRHGPQRKQQQQRQEITPLPDIEEVVEYLQAFYHRLPVKLLPDSSFQFTAWEEDEKDEAKGKKSSKTAPSYIGMNTPTECVRIRTRHSVDGVYPRQLHLDDLLDAAISSLPDDAFAMLLLIHHDLYEDDDDTFVCGRAYGGSRVAVVSTARYNPSLDEIQRLMGDGDAEHAWPASHCQAFLDNKVTSGTGRKKSRDKKQRQKIENKTDVPDEPATKPFPQKSSQTSPLEAAISAHYGAAEATTPQSLIKDLYLLRVCKTTSHELGHCLGIDHCVYFACIMQGTASLAEDARQPPYVCPVDLLKILYTTGSTKKERDAALLAFCNSSSRARRGRRRESPWWAGLAAWLERQI